MDKSMHVFEQIYFRGVWASCHSLTLFIYLLLSEAIVGRIIIKVVPFTSWNECKESAKSNKVLTVFKIKYESCVDGEEWMEVIYWIMTFQSRKPSHHSILHCDGDKCYFSCSPSEEIEYCTRAISYTMGQERLTTNTPIQNVDLLMAWIANALNSERGISSFFRCLSRCTTDMSLMTPSGNLHISCTTASK